jgi:sugar lactone lactonase YvrE
LYPPKVFLSFKFVLMGSKEESAVATLHTGTRYSSVHCTGKGVFLTAMGNGEIHVLAEDGERPEIYTNADGQPAGIAMDKTGRLYIADTALRAVTQNSDDVSNVFVKEYEGKSFRGPSSLAFGPDGSMYFTDSGPLGETTLQNPSGSCFCVTMLPNGGEQILKPLVLESLAHPGGIAVSADGKNIYISELLRNRVLRLFEYPSGVWQTSVYYQFSGSVGPSCLACGKDGTLYVGMFEPSSCAQGSSGTINVLSADGQVSKTISIPGTAIEGLALSDDGSCLYVTEASNKALYKVEL